MSSVISDAALYDAFELPPLLFELLLLFSLMVVLFSLLLLLLIIVLGIMQVAVATKALDMITIATLVLSLTISFKDSLLAFETIR